MIYIHKGDDTDFENQKFLTFNITSDFDMTSWSCIVSLAGVSKTFRDLSSGTFEVYFTSQETSQMQYGTYNLNIKVVDGENRVKTISNSIPVAVTNKVVENSSQEISLKETQLDGIEINVVVSGGEGGTSDHSKLKNLEFENSGHIGFASSEEINTLQSQVNQNSVDIGNLEVNKQPKGDYVTSAEIPTKTSQLTNDNGFITKAVNDLENYYTNENVYTKAEINNIINNFTSLKIEIVNELPSENISTSTFYLIQKEGISQDNVYDEYIYINNSWELIGSTAIDLTDYALKSEIPTLTSQLTNDSDFATNSSLESKADLNLSNCTSSAFVDGAWNFTSKNIFSAATFPINTDIVNGYVDIDLSDYIPNDGYIYEILLNCQLNSNANSAGSTVRLFLKTEGFTNLCMARCITSTAKYSGTTAATIAVPVSASRLFQYMVYVQVATSATCYLDLCGYRRVGTNV